MRDIPDTFSCFQETLTAYIDERVKQGIIKYIGLLEEHFDVPVSVSGMPMEDILSPTEELTRYLKGYTGKGLDADKILSLLRAGADINAPFENGVYKCCLFVLMAREGHVDVVKFLLDQGININIQDPDGYTALMHAIIFSKEVFDLLMTYKDKIDFSKTNCFGETAYNIACNYRKTQMMSALIPCYQKG